MSGDFFTQQEIERFTLPNKEDYRDVDNLQATINIDSEIKEVGRKKR
jgi:hypothetical protein